MVVVVAAVVVVVVVVVVVSFMIRTRCMYVSNNTISHCDSLVSGFLTITITNY